jgi:hypothetical protein
MGWLYQQLNDFFTKDDGSYPEVCVCKLSQDQIRKAYRFIIDNSSYLVGRPFLYNRDQACEQPLVEAEDPVQLVVSGIAQPFHFMARDIRFGKEFSIRELGIFIMPNAIALDFECGPLWGEIEIESFMILTLFILLPGPDSFVRLEQDTEQEQKKRFMQALEKVAIENKEFIKSHTLKQF